MGSGYRVQGFRVQDYYLLLLLLHFLLPSGFRFLGKDCGFRVLVYPGFCNEVVGCSLQQLVSMVAVQQKKDGEAHAAGAQTLNPKP